MFIGPDPIIVNIAGDSVMSARRQEDGEFSISRDESV